MLNRVLQIFVLALAGALIVSLRRLLGHLLVGIYAGSKTENRQPTTNSYCPDLELVIAKRLIEKGAYDKDLVAQKELGIWSTGAAS